MRKYLVFVLSFLLLFIVFQFLSGLILTQMYTPNIEDAWNGSSPLPNETVIIGNNSSFLLTLIFAFISATIAYFIPNRVIKNNR